jgi:hypothetical protein
MTRPEFISCNPAIADSRVDFPQPDGPSRTMKSPAGTSSDTPSSATTRP